MPIKITSKKEGFRRCGVSHPASPVEYPDGRFTDEELKALKAEPMLVVSEFCEIEAGNDGDKKEPKKKKE